MEVAILYNKVYESDGTKLCVGGIQTYLSNAGECL